jgi:hypothetical protein
MISGGINSKWIGETITVYVSNASFTGLFSELRPEASEGFIVLDKGTATETVISINFIQALKRT